MPLNGLKIAAYDGEVNKRGVILFAFLHDHMHTENEGAPTVDACFDTDRLDLARVGIKVDLTDCARKPESFWHKI